jgi:DNA-directed RNA polymerase subunit RPC12/RpoP
MVKRYDQFGDEAFRDSWPVYVAASDYDALAARLAKAHEALRAAYYDTPGWSALVKAALRPTDSASVQMQVKCARCGLAGTSEAFIIEEGDEWECPACWERCEAQERAAYGAKE